MQYPKKTITTTKIQIIPPYPFTHLLKMALFRKKTFSPKGHKTSGQNIMPTCFRSRFFLKCLIFLATGGTVVEIDLTFYNQLIVIV